MTQRQKYEAAKSFVKIAEGIERARKDALIAAIHNNEHPRAIAEMTLDWELAGNNVAKQMLEVEERKILLDIREGKLVLVNAETGLPVPVYTVDLGV